MKIGILQTGHAHEAILQTLGDYDVQFERLLDGNGFTYETYNVIDMAFPQSINACDGWIITGSKHGAYEDHPFIQPLEELIRDIYAAGVPLVGICFGHQIIAQALGGKVEKFPGGWAAGRTSYDWSGQPVTLNTWHQDQVTEIPKDATVLAANDFCRYAALAYGNRIFTTQPHPEYGAQFMNGLLEFRGKGVLPPEILAEAHANLDKPIDSPRIARQIARFFKERVVA